MASLRILGIDPGLNRTGYGLIDVEGETMAFVAAGVIRPRSAQALSARLGDIVTGLTEVIRTYAPAAAAAEKVFVNVNPASTLLLGQARGAALAAAALQGLTVEEFTPSEIKQAAVGTGRAAKEQVQAMMMRMLGLKDHPQADAADALAAAVCLAHTRSLSGRLAAALAGQPKNRIPARGRRSSRAAWTQALEKKL